MFVKSLRRMNSATVVCGSIALLMMVFATSLFADDAEKPTIRTEEDLARGKRNVRSVIEELTELFSADAPLPVVHNLSTQIQPPYCKVIQAPNDRATLIFRPRFTSSKKMFKALDGVITGTTLVEPLDEQNELVISAPKDDVNSYREILEAMDLPSPQILIEAKVVEVMFGDGMQRNLSIMFQGSRYKTGAQTQIPGNTTPTTSGFSGEFTPYAGRDSMNIAFQWLETAQDATVLSSPNILISRNEVSRIVTGEEIPIQEATTTGTSIQMSTKFKNVGVTLEVEPSMINRDNVTLRVYPKVSNVQRYETVSSGDASYSVPVISARSVETHLRMQDKQVVMMGGLYSNRNTLQQQRVPILSDIPLIGELFTGKNELKEVTQLVFFLKIHILSPDQVASGVFYDFDRNAKLSEKLGEIVANSDSYPMHKRSIKKFAEEITGALPGVEQRRRKEFKNTPITLDSENTVKSPETSTQGGLIDNKPTVKVTVESKAESTATAPTDGK
ncbi:MAG: hypothetical protein LBM70_06200 [Victivallales bacterium]|jgi:type II secretory pathway component GspD/PulD (secretin)|nr:hypothetical protein [Victivallales bacterium]